jgi:hypothetical protein
MSMLLLMCTPSQFGEARNQALLVSLCRVPSCSGTSRAPFCHISDILFTITRYSLSCLTSSARSSRSATVPSAHDCPSLTRPFRDVPTAFRDPRARHLPYVAPVSSTYVFFGTNEQNQNCTLRVLSAAPLVWRAKVKQLDKLKRPRRCVKRFLCFTTDSVGAKTAMSYCNRLL